MKRLLHIIGTPRGDDSRTLRVSRSFVEAVNKKYPDLAVDELDLYAEKLPELTVKRVDGKYALLAGKELSGDTANAWDEIVEQIDRFISADAYLISTPMWNFNIPYKLKHYLDIIVQPKYLFRYTATGPEGLVKDKKMLVVTSRGGDYSEGSPARKYDALEPYLRTIFGFVGFSDIAFINAQPMDASGSDVREKKIAEAQDEAIKAAANF